MNDIEIEVIMTDAIGQTSNDWADIGYELDGKTLQLESIESIINDAIERATQMVGRITVEVRRRGI